MTRPTRWTILAVALAALIAPNNVAAIPEPSRYPFEVFGQISTFDAKTHTFVVKEYTVKVSQHTVYASGDKAITRVAFWVVNRKGAWVEVEGKLLAKSVLADEISLRQPGDFDAMKR